MNRVSSIAAAVAAIALGAATLGGACNATTDDSPGPLDGGRDAGARPVDAVNDAHRDQPVDSRQDSTVPDSSTSFVPTWFPDGCHIVQVGEDEPVLAKLEWLDCGNGIPGCRWMDASSIPGAPSAGLQYLKSDGVVVAPQGADIRFAFMAYFDGIHRFGIYDGDGMRLAGWWRHDTDPCTVAALDLESDGTTAVGITRGDTTGIGNQRIFYGALPDVVAGTAPFVDMTAAIVGTDLTTPAIVRFSPSMMTFELSPLARLMVWDYHSTPARLPVDDGISEQEEAVVVGGDVYFRTDGDPSVRGISIRHAWGAIDRLYVKPSVWPAHFQSDGSTAVWQELTTDSNGQPLTELWSAPLSPNGPWTAHRVTTLGPKQFYRGGFVREGWYVYPADDLVLRLVRIADGAHVDVSPPPGYGWVDGVGVVNGEAWATVHHEPGAYALVYSFVRIPVASLPAPTP